MNKLTKGTISRWGAAAGALAVIAVVACGASGGKNKSSSAPLSPLTYDPRVSLSPLVEKVGTAVVNIQTTQKMQMRMGAPGQRNLFEFFFGPQGPGGQGGLRAPERERQATGSGFIIDPQGYVVTNHHVVDGADEIEVMLSDNRTFKASLVGSDERTDVALLKLENARNLPSVTFGSSDQMKVGDRVVAIGNPFGLDHTVTEGIVSAKERVIGAGPYDDFIQTDASINPGNSGGPLFNLSGEVIGINTAISRTGQGIGFAIPSDLARTIIESIKKDGKVTRGWLGVGFQPMDADLARALGAPDDDGALVTNVIPGSPAEKGGILPRDIIVSVDGRKLKTGTELPTRVALVTPGRQIVFEVLRAGKPVSLKIQIARMEGNTLSGGSAPSDTSPSAASALGVEIAELDDGMRRQLDAATVSGGVVVTGVDDAGRAAQALRSGDIIVEINRTGVKSVVDFEKAVGSLRAGDDMLLQIYRRGSWLYVVIRL